MHPRRSSILDRHLLRRRLGARLFFAVSFCCALRGSNARSDADSRGKVRLALENRSGTVCPDTAWLSSAVTSRLGYDPFSAQAADSILVAILKGNRGLRGEVRWAGATRRSSDVRTIEVVSGDCEELARVLALTVSIAIDPLRATSGTAEPAPGSEPGSNPTPGASAPAAASGVPAAGSSAASPSSSASPTLTTPAPSTAPAEAGTSPPPPTSPPPDAETRLETPAPTEVRAAEATDTEQSALSWWIWAGPHGSLGFAPEAAFGADVGAEIASPHFSAGLEVKGDFPESIAYANGTVAIGAALMGTALCGREWILAACALGRFGWFFGQGEAFARSGSGFSPVATLGGRLSMDPWRGDLVRLRLHVDAERFLTVNSFDVDGKPVWMPPPVATTLGLAILVSIP